MKARKIIHKRSSVQGQMPATSALTYGEIAVNFNANDPFISMKVSGTSGEKIVDFKTKDYFENIMGTAFTSANTIQYVVESNEQAVAAAINNLKDTKSDTGHTHTHTAITDWDSAIQGVKTNSAKTADSATTSVSATTAVNLTGNITTGQVTNLASTIQTTKVNSATTSNSATTAANLTGNITTGQVTNLASAIQTTKVNSATTADKVVNALTFATGITSASGSYDGSAQKTITIPSKTSHITNDSGYITKDESGLTYYYKKTETYTQTEVNNLLSAIPKFAIKVVTALPTTGESATIYLISLGTSGVTEDLYKEYIYVDSKWELLGTAKANLQNYYTKTEADGRYWQQTQRVNSAYTSYSANTSNALGGIVAANYYTTAGTNTQISNAIATETARTESIYSKTGHTHSHTAITDWDAIVGTAFTSANTIQHAIESDERVISAAINNLKNTKSDTGHTHTHTAITDWESAIQGVKAISAYTADTANALGGIAASNYAQLNIIGTGFTSANTIQHVIETNEEEVSDAIANLEANKSNTGHTHIQYSLTSHTHTHTAISDWDTAIQTFKVNSAYTADNALSANTLVNNIDVSKINNFNSEVLGVVEDGGYLTQSEIILTKVNRSATADTANALGGVAAANYYTTAGTNTQISNAIATETARTESIYSKTGHTHSHTAITDWDAIIGTAFTSANTIQQVIEDNEEITADGLNELNENKVGALDTYSHGKIANILRLTQSEYDAITTKDDTILYIIIG